jgi:DNA-binding CsgD family transcriptional regulator
LFFRFFPFDKTHAALSTLPREKPVSAGHAAKKAFGVLTERELEVVSLIAQGKSNREIADALVVTKRTVETHMSNILGKLGFTSRAQIVVWAVRSSSISPCVLRWKGRPFSLYNGSGWAMGRACPCPAGVHLGSQFLSDLPCG